MKPKKPRRWWFDALKGAALMTLGTILSSIMFDATTGWVKSATFVLAVLFISAYERHLNET